MGFWLCLSAGLAARQPNGLARVARTGASECKISERRTGAVAIARAREGKPCWLVRVCACDQAARLSIANKCNSYRSLSTEVPFGRALRGGQLRMRKDACSAATVCQLAQPPTPPLMGGACRESRTGKSRRRRTTSEQSPRHYARRVSCNLASFHQRQRASTKQQ